jgi:hypothetical protein
MHWFLRRDLNSGLNFVKLDNHKENLASGTSPWDADSWITGQKNPILLWLPMSFCSLYKSSPLTTSWARWTSLHPDTLLFKNRINFLIFALGVARGLFSSGLPILTINIFHVFLSSHIHVTSSYRVIIHHVITTAQFSEIQTRCCVKFYIFLFHKPDFFLFHQ